MSESWQLEHDWYGGGIPANVEVGRDVYIDSSYAFAACRSKRSPAVLLGDCCGIYDRATIVVGTNGTVRVGEYTCLNGTYIICHDLITIGAHCLLSWGVVIADAEPDHGTPLSLRRAALRKAASHPDRCLPPVDKVQPVTIEDNVWVGFDAVVLPGVTIGRGSIVGCKSIVAEDIPPYSIVVGNSARCVRRLEPNDTEATRQQAFRECFRA